MKKNKAPGQPPLFTMEDDAPPVPPSVPLADRMRPARLEDFAGQEHLLGEGKPLLRMVQSGRIGSLIFWGPPGTGKTTLAHLIARTLGLHFFSFSAVLTGIKEVKEAMSDAAYVFQNAGRQTLVFIDEIHRFNKAQQDAFLPFIEKGQIILVGTTTVNPSFDLNAALLSRVKVFRLHSLEDHHLEAILRRAMKDVEQGLGRSGLELPPEVLRQLVNHASGDARRALNLLEQLAVHLTARTEREAGITPEILADVLQGKTLLYDRDGEEHYNLLSALHKSMRNSDVHAAVYWTVRMLEAGEDPRNICRRIIQCASEDVGLADNQCLALALQAWQAYELLGLPEARLAILQAAIYTALAPKSNAVLRAWLQASQDLEQKSAGPVPLHLRNAPTRLMKAEGYGQDYLYAHDYPEGTTDMPCLPPVLAGRQYYRPGQAGLETRLADKLEEIARRKEQFASRTNKNKATANRNE